MSHIVAFMPAFNEEDIILASIQHLIKQGVEVYVLDNWSTDGTFELAQSCLGKGVLAVEHLPRDGPPPFHKWRDVLLRIEELSAQLEADWFLLNGADELRRSAWKAVDLRTGLDIVDREGYSCVDYAVMEFPPVDNDFQPGADPEAHFKFFEWGDRTYHFIQRNTWKNTGKPIALADSAGHDVAFEGKRVYPYKFLLKHYPVRSQAHGEKKVLRERRPRYDPEEVRKGWNTHYDHIGADHVFLRPAGELTQYDEDTFPGTPLPDGRELVDWGNLSVVSTLRLNERRSNELLRRLRSQEQAAAALTEAQSRQAALLSEIQESTAWRLIQSLRRLRLAAIPSGSARERLWYRLLRLLSGVN